MNHLNIPDVLALLLILGMIWKTAATIIRAADKLENHEIRIRRIEKKMGVPHEVEQ